jgi:hypothetical protein
MSSQHRAALDLAIDCHHPCLRIFLVKRFMDSYRLKLSWQYTPETIRVYCANAQCARYHHPRSFDNSDQHHTIVACDCGTTTCVGCKSEWKADHTCVQLTSTNRPAWVPEYSSNYRIKQCPSVGSKSSCPKPVTTWNARRATTSSASSAWYLRRTSTQTRGVQCMAIQMQVMVTKASSALSSPSTSSLIEMAKAMIALVAMLSAKSELDALRTTKHLTNLNRTWNRTSRTWRT